MESRIDNFDTVRVYGIRNKETQEYWVAESNKFKWYRKQDAMGAWWRWNDSYFRDQNEYEIVEFKLVELTRKAKETNKYYREKVGLK